MIIKDALPLELAESVRRVYVEQDSAFLPETNREVDFYKNKSYDRDWLPSSKEVYRTWFRKSYVTAADPAVVDAVQNHILPLARKTHAGAEYSISALLCYKLDAGMHLRIHDDAYSGSLGFIWYLSKGWKWDWGGLLLSVNDAGEASVAMPVFNQLVFIDHGSAVPHCVTPVCPWALESRMMLVGLLKN